MAPATQRLADAKRLSEYRRGKLPTVRTSKLMEGGEICHWEGPCSLTYRTAKNTIEVTGELVLTSKRVIFVSPSKGLEFSPAKILDLILLPRGGGLEIRVSSRQGSGTYRVADASTVEAILCGMASRHKYRSTSEFTSERSRHIPPDVRREVWARDGGRCVQCGVEGPGAYLEFDHIIPHTKGGANTVGNVQLLCRRCNLGKSDRI